VAATNRYVSADGQLDTQLLEGLSKDPLARNYEYFENVIARDQQNELAAREIENSEPHSNRVVKDATDFGEEKMKGKTSKRKKSLELSHIFTNLGSGFLAPPACLILLPACRVTHFLS
jgi:hypothetical protein